MQRVAPHSGATRCIPLTACIAILHRPSDMNAPAWRLHPLSGDRDGEWSVWVDENYRLTFAFNDEGDAVVVDYGDYH